MDHRSQQDPSAGEPVLPIYAVTAPGEGGGLEQNRANAIARLGATDATGPGTFFPAERAGGLDFEAAFEDWRTTLFLPWLGPRFIAVHLAAARMETERIQEIDREIDTHLSPAARQRSLEAARPFLEGRTEIRSQPQWVKFLQAAEQGRTPGHLPTIFSLQAALFHLPLLPAMTAYVNLEGANGLAAMAGGERWDLDRFAETYPEGAEAARLVFQAGWSMTDADSSDDGFDAPGGGRLVSV